MISRIWCFSLLSFSLSKANYYERGPENVIVPFQGPGGANQNVLPSASRYCPQPCTYTCTAIEGYRVGIFELERFGALWSQGCWYNSTPRVSVGPPWISEPAQRARERGERAEQCVAARPCRA